jgi:hypothetical protein
MFSFAIHSLLSLLTVRSIFVGVATGGVRARLEKYSPNPEDATFVSNEERLEGQNVQVCLLGCVWFMLLFYFIFVVYLFIYFILFDIDEFE